MHIQAQGALLRTLPCRLAHWRQRHNPPRRHLYRRTGVRDQRSLLAWGLDQGLLRPHDLLQQRR